MIQWSILEIDMLMSQAVKEFGLPDKWPRSRYTTINKIQEKVLLKERWRVLNGAHTVNGRINNRIDEWLQAGGPPGDTQAKVAAPLPRPPAPAPMAPAHWRAGGSPTAVPPTPPAAPTRAAVPPAPQAPTPGPLPWGAAWPRPEQISDVLSTFLAGVLVDSIKKALVHHEVAGIINTLRAGGLPNVAMMDHGRHDPAPTASGPPKEDKLTVLVCGMLSHQQGTLQSRFPKMHLKFFIADKASGGGLEQLRQKAKDADVVLFKMDQTSHAHVLIPQSMGKKIVRVTGSIDGMIQALQSIAESQPS